MEQLIGIKQAAELLGVTIQTLRRWDKQGKLPPVRLFNGPRRYKLSDIKALQNNYEKNIGTAAR